MAEEATAVQEVMSFESEAERQAALASVPEAPPIGTRDVQAWEREMEEKEAQIEKAVIKPKDGSGESPAPKQPEQAVQDVPPSKEPIPAQAPQKKEEPTLTDEEIVIKVKRSELPEELRQYKNGDQIVKQFAHARGNINRISERLQQTEQELDVAKSNAEKVQAMQKQIEELQKASKSVERTVDQQPQSQAKSKMQDRIALLNKSIEELSKDDDLGTSDTSKLRDTFNGMAGVLNDAVIAMSQTEQKFASYRNEVEGKYKNLETEILSNRALAERQKQEKESMAAIESLVDLQTKVADLQTSKPVITDSGRGSIEEAVIKFADTVNGSPIPRGNREQFWATVNKYVNMYNRQDPEMVSLCQKDGIFPANFGVSDTDVTNYATLVNVDAIQRGERIDPESGKREVLTDFRGRQITFPDAESAYKYMVDKMGIRDKIHQKQLIEAEKKGQRALEASLSKRDVSDSLIGPEGHGSPDNMGQEITKEMALEIAGDIQGQNTVDEERMANLILQGKPDGWVMFDRLNQANRRLGLPVEFPDPAWPPRINAQK